MAFASDPQAPQGGFMSGLFSVIGPEIDRRRAQEDKLKDSQAQVYMDALKSGRLTPEQSDYALQQLSKLYGGKSVKEMLGRVGQAIKHVTGQGGSGQGPGQMALPGPQQGKSGAPGNGSQPLPSASMPGPSGAMASQSPADKQAHQAFPGATNPTAVAGPASNPGQPLNTLPKEWSDQAHANSPLPPPPGVGGQSPPSQPQFPSKANPASPTGAASTSPATPSPAAQGPAPSASQASSAPTSGSGGPLSWGGIVKSGFKSPEELADLAAARQLNLDKSLLTMEGGLKQSQLEWISKKASQVMESDASPQEKHIQLEALGIKDTIPKATEIKNIPGAALSGLTDKFGNPVKADWAYTQTSTGELYPETPKPQKPDADELLAKRAGVPVSRVAKARLTRLERPPTAMMMPPIQVIPDDELRALAQREIQTGDKPSFGLSARDPNRGRYNKILADEWHQDPEAIEAKAAYKAGAANLNQLTKVQGQVAALEDSFKLDTNNAIEAESKVPRSFSRSLNKGIQWLQQHASDDPALQQFLVATQTVANTYARIMSSGGRGGTSTVSAQDHAMNLIDAAMAHGSYKAAIEQLKKEADNISSGLQSQIDEQKKNFRKSGNKAGNAALPPPTSSGVGSDAAAEEYLKSIGGVKRAQNSQ